MNTGVNEGVNGTSEVPEVQTRSLIHSQESEGVQLNRTLLEVGVFALSSTKRDQAAQLLQRVGCTVAELIALRDYLAEGADGDQGMVRRCLAALVADEVKLRDALAGLRVYLRAQAPKSKPVDQGPPHVPNLPLGATGCRCTHCEGYRSRMPQAEPWDHDEQSMKVKAMIDGDRKSIAWVAELLAVHESTVESMLARGRVLLQRRDPPAPRLLKTKGKPAVEETPEERKARVREFVRARSKAVTP